MRGKKVDKKGEINFNNFGSKMEIIEYRKYNDIDIYFEEYDWIYHGARYDHFKEGTIKCPYEKRTHSVGYIGEGKYNSGKAKNLSSAYMDWVSMLQRCYDPYKINERMTYIDCFVCEEWHNFQNFAKWYEENYYQVNNEVMTLDKDILYKGNKIYSPKTCIYVPQRINNLFVKSDKVRGEYPIGVSWSKKECEFIAKCRVLNKDYTLGRYATSDEAFQSYKKFKEKVIKNVADEYKEFIPIKLYNAMYEYEIKIND